MTATKIDQVIVVSLPNASNEVVEQAKRDLSEAFGEKKVVVIANQASVSIVNCDNID